MTPDEALELLRPALDPERPLIRLQDLREQLEANEAVLWMGRKSAVFTQCTAYPKTAEFVCEGGPAGGDLVEIRDHMLPQIEAWARAAGCTQAQLTVGRRGWVRALRALGYEEYATIMRKIL